MRKLFTIVLLFSFTSCVEAPKEVENVSIKYPYVAGYSSDWKMGDPNHSLIVLNLQKFAEEGNYDEARKLFHPEITIYSGDGSSIKGLNALDLGFRDFIENSNLTIQPQVWIPVVNKNGENWVLLWTYEEHKEANGSVRKLYAQESFQIKDNKIVTVNQFQKDLVE